MDAAKNTGRFSVRRAIAMGLAAVVAGNLFFPSFALATVRVDDVELAQGVNEVGGGTATLNESDLEMEGVTAAEFYTDEDLTINYADGNVIDTTTIEGDATVEMNFDGENEISDIAVTDEAQLTINANEHNTFGEVIATDDSSVAINVDGTTEFGSIDGADAATVAVSGAKGAKDATLNLGTGREFSFLDTEDGNLSIDNLTLNLNAREAILGSALGGTVTVNSSTLAAGEDNGFVFLSSGADMLIKDSTMEFGGMVFSIGQMTIDNSNMRISKPTAFSTEAWPHRVSSRTGIDLRNELNGIVMSGVQEGRPIYFLDTNENFGRLVELWAGAQSESTVAPAEDGSVSSTSATTVRAAHIASKALPRTGDATVALLPLLVAGVLLVIGAFLTGRLQLAGAQATQWAPTDRRERPGARFERIASRTRSLHRRR